MRSGFPDFSRFFNQISHCGPNGTIYDSQNTTATKETRLGVVKHPITPIQVKTARICRTRKYFMPTDQPTDPVLDAGNDGNQTIFYERPNGPFQVLSVNRGRTEFPSSKLVFKNLEIQVIFLKMEKKTF